MKTILTKTIISLSLILLGFTVAHAQSYEFMILGVQGDVKSSGDAVKVGATLSSGQSLTIGSGAYAGLAHTSGSTLELTKAGTYTVADLKKQAAANSGSADSRLVSFIMDELTGGQKAQKKSGDVKYGSVTRTTKPVQVTMPSKANVLKGSKILLKWRLKGKHTNVKADAYKLIVRDRSMNVLEEVEVKDAECTLDLSKDVFQGHKMLTYSVEVAGNRSLASGLYAFTIKDLLSSDAEFSKEHKMLTEHGQSAMGKIVLAKFYEQNQLVSNAVTAYETAINLSEGDSPFQVLYDNFRHKNNF